MVSGMHAAVSALSALGSQAAVTAHNVANLLTEGFEKSRVEFQEIRSGGVQAKVRGSQSTALPDASPLSGMDTASLGADPAEELLRMTLTRRAYAANVQVLRAADDNWESLLNIRV